MVRENISQCETSQILVCWGQFKIIHTVIFWLNFSHANSFKCKVKISTTRKSYCVSTGGILPTVYQVVLCCSFLGPIQSWYPSPDLVGVPPLPARTQWGTPVWVRVPHLYTDKKLKTLLPPILWVRLVTIESNFKVYISELFHVALLN